MIAVVATGVANLASVLAAVRRAGVEPVPTTDPEVVRTASHVVLPGVGRFAAGMDALRHHGLVAPLQERIAAGAPTLGICLGLQLLAMSSDEDPGVLGLGVLDTHVERLPDGVPVPHLGWSRVAVDPGARLLRPGTGSFAHSYTLRGVPEGWTGAWAVHGEPFVAGVERGRILGLQLHPELSGRWGQELLEDWLSGREGGMSGGALGGRLRRIIPCLDVDRGRVVKGVRFSDLRDSGDPAERAARYADGGADELVMLDVSATVDGRETAVATVRAIRRVLPVPLTVGGGIRSVDDARRLLDAGADKIAVNSAAVARPELLGLLADQFGTQCVVLALDAARRGDGWEVVVRSGRERTGIDAVRWAVEAVVRGAGEVLLTSWDRDGTGDGYDLPLVSAVSGAVGVPIVASGGASRTEHLVEVLEAGADAALIASMVHDEVTTVDQLKAELETLGVEVRR